MGNPWETGAPKDHIRVDDGLEGYYLPLSLCSSRKVIMACQTPHMTTNKWQVLLSLLSHKFETGNLPGLGLVKKTHLELWSWDGKTKLDNDTWAMHVKSGKGLKVSFVMSTLVGFNHSTCVRCGEKSTGNVYSRKYSIW
jgi:hypothetical protein